MKRKAIDEYASSGKNDKFGMMYVSMLKSKRYQNLSIGAKQLYLCCRAEANSDEGKSCLYMHGQETGTMYTEGRDFAFPASHLKEFGIDRSNAVKWFRELENAGFITVLEKNKNRRKMNVYSFSSGWKGPTRMVKFVSYDGRYPNLCSGTLILEVDGKKRELSHALYSGGSCGFYKDGNEFFAHGQWSVDLPEDLEPYRKEIEELVNDEVPHGCCGGCL